jgi:uncharacterized repeat protein (TIGR01451 family)/CSLREA domain-containing protein
MTTFKNTSKKSGQPLKYTTFVLLCALGGTPAWANNITVNNLTDITSPGDGICSLREAISNANSNSDVTIGDCPAGTGADTISFSVGGTIILNNTLSITDAAGLTLDGVGRSVTLSGNNAVRVLLVNPGANLTVTDLTVANGFDPSMGAGIYNQSGILNVVKCTFSGNGVSGRVGGGGITNSGTLIIVNSTFSGNRGAGAGGGIYNQFGGSLSIINSTIVGNSVTTSICPPGNFCTDQGDGGGIYNRGTMNLDNSIVAGNTATLGSPDIGGFIDTASYNIITDSSLLYRWNGLGLPIYLNGNNGNIAVASLATVLNTTLANNGGSTQTLALLPGSQAINTALPPSCPATDQRGVVRPQGMGCDIGSYEVAVTTDLAITEIANPSPAMVSDSLNWTIVVKNSSTVDATGVKVIDTLPAGLTSITANASQGICVVGSSGIITCDLGNLANGISANITVSGVPITTGTITNQVVVSSNQLDSQLANNTVTLSTPVQALLCNGVKPTIVGTTGPDIISGTSGRDVIHGLSGNDTISGGNDNDIICGGEGQDNLKGDTGNDTLNGGAGTDSCNGGKGTDSATNCEAKTSIP